MTRFLALLRGINVGGKILKMDALRKAMEALPVSDVSTYIQSGNLFFTAKEGDAATWENRISDLIADAFGMEVAVIVRTKEDLEEALASNPYPTEDEDVNPYYGFLSEVPTDEHRRALEAIDFGRDTFTIVGRTIYLMYADGAGTTKLTNAVIERKLKMKGTMRNRKTVRKLLDLMAQ